MVSFDNFLSGKKKEYSCYLCGAEYKVEQMRACWTCSKTVCKNCSTETKLYVEVICRECQ